MTWDESRWACKAMKKCMLSYHLDIDVNRIKEDHYITR